jgi:hypothetical protein
VLCQLEVGLPVVLEAARRSTGFFVLNAAPAMDLPAELLERCDLVIVNETEYQLIPALADAKLVAVTYGKNGSAMFERGRKVAEAPASCGDGGEHDRCGRCVLRGPGAGAGAAGRTQLRARAGRGQRRGGRCRGRSVVTAGAGTLEEYVARIADTADAIDQ